MSNTWADGPFNPSQKLHEATATDCPNCTGFEKRSRAKGSSGHFAKFTIDGVKHEAPDIWIAGRSNRSNLPAKDAYLAACKEYANGCRIEIEMEKKRSKLHEATAMQTTYSRQGFPSRADAQAAITRLQPTYTDPDPALNIQLGIKQQGKFFHVSYTSQVGSRASRDIGVAELKEWRNINEASGEPKYTFRIKDVPIKDTEYNGLPFGRRMDYNAAIAAFKRDAKSMHFDTKGKSFAKGFAEWKALYQPTQWFCIDRTGPMWKDDSAEVWYTK